ncbi:MAG: FtsX-like permease family protein [Solirubrobacteraceae bacterium]
MLSYARRDLLRNPRRTLASLVGVVLGIGLFSAVLFFVDGSGASMTKRALAPLAIDLQRVSTAPLGGSVRLAQRLAGQGPLKRGQRQRVELVVRNEGAAAAGEVTVKTRLPPGLTYVPGSARRGGKSIPDVAGESPFSHGAGHIGHNLGAVDAGSTVRLGYEVRARRAIPRPWGAALRAAIAWREHPVPEPANLPALVDFATLRDRVAAVPGVAAANRLAFVSLPAGSLRAGATRIDRPVKVFAFTAAYAHQYPAVRVVRGGFAPGAALLSPEAARGLGAAPGTRISLALPGGGASASLPVSGVADLSRARALFNSREGNKLEDFLYVPDSIVVSPDVFDRLVIPAFRRAAARRGDVLALKSPPTVELDIALQRSRLQSDPGQALVQTRAVAGRVRAIASQQDFLLDNISNTLTVARADAAVAKHMFAFLGLPGLLLAGFLAAYAGAVLAAAQRREQAMLRLRGARSGQLARILAYRTVALAGLGSLLGTAAGFAATLLVLGPSAMLEASAGRLLGSAALALVAGVSATGLALFVPGWRALRREVSGERRELAEEPVPLWRRARLDMLGLAAAGAAAVIVVRTGGFDAPRGVVSTGEATTLRSGLLVVPLAVWFAGILLAVRVSEAAAVRLPHPAPPRFGPVVRGVLSRTISRRARSLVLGVAGVGLVMAFGVGLATFAATYDGAKAADAAFTVGADLRVTPSPVSGRAHPAAFGRRLLVGGVNSVAPVVFGLENSTLTSDFNSDAQDLAAIDPAAYAATAPLAGAAVVGTTARGALAHLRAHPRHVLVRADVADGLKLKVGDRAEVLLARGTRHQKLLTMRVGGLFTRLPGFPEGVDVVVGLDVYQGATGIRDVDFFLARTARSTPQAHRAAAAALRRGPGAGERLNVDTTETTFNKDASSLTALNVRGLVDLNAGYTLAIVGAVIAIFVFGRMLQRRREYVVLLAMGLPARRLQLVILGEAGFAAAAGLLAGLTVGAGLGTLLVRVLQPLFILAPVTAVPLVRVTVLVVLLALATAGSALAALHVLRRLRPSEILRER